METDNGDGSEPSEEYSCPFPGCERVFSSEKGVSLHHVQSHGESIAGVETECSWCGDTIRKKRTKVENEDHLFCDNQCRGDWRSENISGKNHPNWSGKTTVECEWCGEVEEMSVAEAESDPHRFCSPECQGEWRSENRSGEQHPSWKGGKVEVECEWCGEEKHIDPHEASEYEAHFCDWECAGKWRSENFTGENNPSWKGGKVTVECEWCGEEKEARRDRVEKNEHQFCDANCQGKWLAENQTGENAPAWKGGVTRYGSGWTPELKERVRNRQGRECAGCSVHQSELPRRLDVHHIKPARSFGEGDDEARNDDTNLVALCRSCHGKWEKMAPLRPQTPTAE